MQILLQELLQPGQLEAIAQADDFANLRLAIDAGEEPDRPLDFRHEVVEHRPQSLEHSPGVFRLGRVALEQFRLGEAELHFLGQGPRKVVAADRHVTDPNLLAVRHHQGRIIASHVEDDDEVVLPLGHSGAMSHLVITEDIVQRQRGNLNQFELDLVLDIRPHRLRERIPLHREQTDFRIQQKAAFLDPGAQSLVVPDDIFQSKRNLLPGFILHNLVDPLGFHRRQLNEPRQRGLPRHRHGDLFALQVVPRQERLHRIVDDLIRNGIRLGQNLGVLDVIEGRRHHLASRLHILELDRLESGLPDVDAPRS